MSCKNQTTTSFARPQCTNQGMFGTLDCDGQQVHVFVQTVLLHSGSLANVNEQKTTTFWPKYTGQCARQLSNSVAAWSLLHQQLDSTEHESSSAQNAQHGVHCMHASDKTATWCYINFNAMRTVSCIDARQFRPLRANNEICDIQCRAQSLHVCMKRRSCTSAACAEQAPEHNHDFTTLVQLAAKCAKLSSGMQWQALQNLPIK